MIHQFWSVEGIIGKNGLAFSIEEILGMLGRGLQYLLSAVCYAEPRCIWIVDEESARLFQRACAKYKGDAFDIRGGRNDDDEMASRVTVKQKIVETGAECVTYFQFPALLSEWGLGDAPPDEAIAALEAYERLMDVEVIYKPSGTGVRAIRAQHAKCGKLDNLQVPGRGLEPFEIHQPRAILWTRDLTPLEAGAKWIHAYDKRASYLHAADVPLGVGDWVYADDCAINHNVKLTTPGVWRVELPDGRADWRKDVALGRLGVGQDNWGWFYSPMVKALRALGYPITVREGWYFPSHKQVLKKWRDRMIEGLLMAEGSEFAASMMMSAGNDVVPIPAPPRPAMPYLRKLIKSTYTRSIGLLGSKTFSHDTLYRPDWRGQIVDEASARMLHNIQRVAAINMELGKMSLAPVAVYDDCLYYVSDLSSPYAATPILTAGGNLSQKFQLKGSAPLDDEARELLKGTPAKFARDIKRLMERGRDEK